MNLLKRKAKLRNRIEEMQELSDNLKITDEVVSGKRRFNLYD